MSAQDIHFVQANGGAVAGASGSAAVQFERREQIARRAYEISLSPWGRSCAENWAQAEEELRAQRSAWPEPR